MTTTRRIAASLLAALMAVLSAAAPFSASAEIIGYAVRSDGDDQLYQINLTTGVVTAVGPVGFEAVEGLSFQPGTGALFGWDEAADQLIRIDLATGAGTAVGPSGFMPMDVGLTFDAAGNLWLADEGSRSFWSVDVNSGAATLVGSTGREITALAAGNGLIYGIDDENNQLVTINTSKAAATVVGGLGINVGDTGMDFDPLGTLWGLEDDGRIFTINPATGFATPVHGASTARNDFEGLAIIIPEPASVLLALVAAGLFTVRRAARRCRQSTTTIRPIQTNSSSSQSVCLAPARNRAG